MRIIVGLILSLLAVETGWSQEAGSADRNRWELQRVQAVKRVHSTETGVVLGVVSVAAGVGVMAWSRHADLVQNLGYSCTRAGGFGPGGVFPCVDVPPSTSHQFSEPVFTIGLGATAAGLVYFIYRLKATRAAKRQLRAVEELGRQNGWIIGNPSAGKR